MPLIKCGDCQSNYSNYSPVCPDCARPTKTQINHNNIPRANNKYPKITKEGDDLRYDLSISSKDANSGKNIKITIPKLVNCDKCRGTGEKQIGSTITCKKCSGLGQINKEYKTLFGTFYQIKECSSCHGFGTDPCISCRGTGIKQTRKELFMNLPTGVKQGTKLKLNGEGNKGLRGGLSGDLYIFIKITN